MIKLTGTDGVEITLNPAHIISYRMYPEYTKVDTMVKTYYVTDMPIDIDTKIEEDIESLAKTIDGMFGFSYANFKK